LGHPWRVITSRRSIGGFGGLSQFLVGTVPHQGRGGGGGGGRRFSSEFHVKSTLEGQTFSLDEFHKAYHHYIKVVPTMYEVAGQFVGSNILSYQMLSQVKGFLWKEGWG